MKRIAGVILAASSLMASSVWAVSPYPELKIKAERSFDFGEWASASAMFDLMLEEQPAVPQTYGQAIVANAMCGSSERTMELMTRALDNHIPFDTVFTNVRQWSYHIGKPVLFENFLKRNREVHPWMRRTVNAYLLKYYAFRRNGAAMVEYAELMLDGASNNLEFLSIQADGYMLTGDFTTALSIYEKILTIDPNNYQTLLMLGNWYTLNQANYPSHRRAAAEYLSRAYAINPTPYVKKLLSEL